MSRRQNTIYMMYHELELPERKLCRDDPGYVRYCITADDFRDQLISLRNGNFAGMSVSEATDPSLDEQPGIAITFDDGCETDLTVAAPLLKEFDCNATFYVVAGFVGRPGYMSQSQVRELSEQGLEVGCHSMTHRYLSDLDADQLRIEIVDAKEKLEEMIGKPVDHFSCPGGRWSPVAAKMAQHEAGFRTMTTSRIGANSPRSDPFRLARMAVMRGMTTDEFNRLCRSEGLMLLQAKSAALAAAKGLLGNSMYEKLRSNVLDQS